jgi:hypothetical protein
MGSASVGRGPILENVCRPANRDIFSSAPVAETPGLIAGEIQQCLEDRAAEGLPLTVETRQVDVEVEVAA